MFGCQPLSTFTLSILPPCSVLFSRPSLALRFPSLCCTLHSQVTICATSTQEEGTSLCRISSSYQLKPKLFSATCFWAHWEFALLPDTLMLHRLFLIHLYKNEGKAMIIVIFIKAGGGSWGELVTLLCQERFLLAFGRVSWLRTVSTKQT